MTGTLRWFKSSYSNDSGGDCVEVAHDWFKSSYSSDSGGECIEVATAPELIHIRDSKTPTQPHLTLAPTTWQTFVAWTSNS